MTEHGWERDEWPAVSEQVLAADILVLLSPIWLGEKWSVCKQVIERVGGCIITGNEDGATHCAINILYSLQHLGFTIPPQADSGWMGEAGPGPSYRNPRLGRAGERLTNRNTAFLTWNLMHVARMLKDAGCRVDYPHPDYR
jgi:multimeric flavodoxin WrbA